MTTTISERNGNLYCLYQRNTYSFWGDGL